MKKIADNILAIILGLIVLIMFAQVVFRYAFNNSLTWSEEVAKFLFIWITFFGAALCIRDNMHIGVDFFIEKLPQRWKKYAKLTNIVLVTIFNGAMGVIGFLWVFEVSGTLSPALSLPLNLVFYSALPLSAAFAFIFGTQKIKNELHNIRLIKT